MAVIDAALLLMNNVDAGAKVTSDVLDLGANGAIIEQLCIDVKLTTGVTKGAVESIEVETSADKEFSSPNKEMTVNVKLDKTAQKRPCQLAHFNCPITPGGRYLRIIANGSTTSTTAAEDITGGKLWAYLANDIQVML